MSYDIKFRVGQNVFLKSASRRDKVEEIIIKDKGIFYKLENTLGLVKQSLLSDKKFLVKVYNTQTGEEIVNEGADFVNVTRQK